MSTSEPSAVASLAALGSRLWRSVPAEAHSVAQLEGALGVALPPSYKQFLLQFGAVAAGDSVISGIVGNNPLSTEGTSLFGDTQRFRAEHQLPARYLVVQPDAEALYCFDTLAPLQSGELGVVCYELHSGHAQPIAASFNEWVVRFFAPTAK